MVRLKSRYILFEVLYPEADTLDGTLKGRGNKDILLQHHRVSPGQITTKTIIYELRRVLQFNFGDYGAGKVNSLLQVKYFSNRTSTGIIRCSREDYELVIIALMLMNKLDEVEGLIINPVKVSGTIKRIEQHAIRRNERLLAIIHDNKERATEHFDSISDDDTED
ncbi:LANO_0C01860g1_1 [Lachancea nothofagi CBS 11611]|uniref:Ribonuclease P/MRP protein subunit POP5 n=1 Tax=Lachancea nothofagi CBS 11611 TaxID=1266666 RepID=A0A1G4J4F1_9SACH|nr:LANO_0C01860g1_1 [Lachancea nothofagi CBS 11611]